jgi:EAL domain-containing protein (putative c-di-GMP-specific phosphodiesterase class I)
MTLSSRDALFCARSDARRQPDGTAHTPPQVLLVGADPGWSRAVRAAARALGGAVVTAVPSGRPALACLLDTRRHFTHVLLNPARTDGLLGPILGLTGDEAESGRETLLLGRSAEMPAHACVIPGRSRHAVRAALEADLRAAPPAPPSIAVLRDALADKRFDTRYQPVVWLADGRPGAVEALARLHRVGRGVIAPEHFVPRIEDAGLAAELTQLVARRSFADIASAPLAPHGLTVALNVPLDVLVGPDALQRLEADRAAAGLAARRVVIELTESRVVSDLRQLGRVVEQLRRAGYGVAIDDLGPTMPRYQALLDIPFTAVKLDKTIMQRSAAGGEAAAFMAGIIGTAKARGLKVVVEGVEDLTAWHRARNAGADMAQGFLIARPLPAAALPAWLEAWRARSGFD